MILTHLKTKTEKQTDRHVSNIREYERQVLEDVRFVCVCFFLGRVCVCLGGGHL